jgi:dinuclear metal center YbgI/SA1388 family protein
MIIKEITDYIELHAPLSLQESYDNAGLIIGDKNSETTGVLICIDITEEVLNEAIQKKCNLIISHHPLIFKGIKKINGNNFTEKLIIKAIKNDIAIYAAHTNLDNIIKGVNSIIADKLGLKNIKILSPKNGLLKKLITFCPVKHLEILRTALFEAGAGHIGNYDSCSFNAVGKGTFRALENANPFVGELNQLHTEEEIKIETIFPSYLENKIIKALLASHPYEEVAYDIISLENEASNIGSGVIGELENEENTEDFLLKVKNITKTNCIRHSKIINNKIKKIALCGGSGSFLIKDAIASGADILITGDIKYHDFFEADNKIILADIGHYESEQFTKDLLSALLIKKFPNFAVFISDINTNPIFYVK